MPRLSYPTGTVLFNKITRNRIVPSFIDSTRNPLGRRPKERNAPNAMIGEIRSRDCGGHLIKRRRRLRQNRHHLHRIIKLTTTCVEKGRVYDMISHRGLLLSTVYIGYTTIGYGAKSVKGWVLGCPDLPTVMLIRYNAKNRL